MRLNSDHHGRGDEEHAEQHLVVALRQRLEHQPADAGPGEDRLGQDGAADDLPGLEAGQRHDRQDGVAGDVAARDRARRRRPWRAPLRT